MRENFQKIKLPQFIGSWLRGQLEMWFSQGILGQNQIEEIKNLYHWPQELSVEEKPPLRLISVFFYKYSFLSLILFSLSAGYRRGDNFYYQNQN